MPLHDLIKKVQNRHALSADETRVAFDFIFTGHAAPESIAAFLLTLHDKGENADEILGAVTSMRSKALTITAPEDTIDIVGTGGDGRNTLNVSTAAAIVVAACGVKVAKHGNRASTSRSGSSDVLAALGINLETSFPVLEQCLQEANLCFLFAPRHHPAMRYVADVRKKLGVRTIFNLLGPLTNPANVKRHLIGVYDAAWLNPMAVVLRSLGSHTAWLTHGHDGMDELTTGDSNDVVALKNDVIDAFTLTPQDAGIHPLSASQEIRGGDAAYNAEALKNIMAGAKNAYHDIVVFNAAAALNVAGKVTDLRSGVALASEALVSGAARDILARLVSITNADSK